MGYACILTVPRLDNAISNLYSNLYRLEYPVKKRKSSIQKQRAGREASASASEGTRPDKLEETLEFTNLTDFRKSLLNFIPRVQENEYLRFVITKRGKPVAVVLSYDAYNLLKRVAERVMDEDDAKEPAVALQEAYQELIGDTTPVPSSVDVTTGRNIPEWEMLKVRRVTQMAVEEYIRAMKKRFKDVQEQEEIPQRDFEKL